MQETLETPAVVRARPRAVRVVACLVLAGWIGVMVATVLLGYRASTFTDLGLAVQDGRVSEVHVSGGLPPGGPGMATVHLTWREGLINHSTYVQEVRGRGQAPSQQPDYVTDVLRAPAVDWIRGSNPDVRIDDQGRKVTYPNTELLGWSIGGAGLVLPFLAVWLLTWVLVALTPWPRRATSWAWAWMVLGVPVIGSLAFLLLSGALRIHFPRATAGHA